MNKKSLYIFLILILLMLSTACSSSPKEFVQENPNTYQKIDADNAKALQESNKALIIDVRTDAEYSAGHIINAVSIPLDTINSNFESLYPDKDFIYIVYCQSGSRSKQAAQLLLEHKYNYVYDFGGINNWPFDIEK